MRSEPLKSAYLSHPTFALHEMGDAHPEQPARLAAVHDALEQAGLLDAMDSKEPVPASAEQLVRAHSQAHLDRLEQASPSKGMVRLDADTSMNPHSLAAAKLAAGAAVMAVELVCKGGYDRVFCNTRPPGHHAERNRPMGFCLFNSIAVGALHALETLGIQRVTIIDFDVHHGNGTEDIFQADDRVIMASTFQSGLYPGTGEQALGPNMFNVPLPAQSDGQMARAALDKHWRPAIMDQRPELILISAGFDAHQDDQLAGLRWHEDDYHWLTDQIVGMAVELGHGRVVSMLEGGYALRALGASAAAHVRALIQVS